MKQLTLVLLALGLVLGGCDRDSVTGPPPPDLTVDRAGSPALKALTYNVYVGARIDDLLLVENPNDIPFVAADLFANVQATDFAERAEAIVDQIERGRPHVIGLQEISLFRIQSPGDFLMGNPTPATTPEIDFLTMLTQALANRGLGYTVRAMSTNFDIELPMVNFTTGGLDDIRLTDYDVILVRNDVAWTNPQNANFAAALPVELVGQTLFILRGWASVDITFKGLPYRFVNTHLEPADIAPGVVDPLLAALQAAQAAELLAIVGQSPYPTIMVGDLNTAADGSTTATYQTARDAGFVDAWLIGPPRGAGYTSNQAKDLLNPTSQLFHRIDFVFYRDEFTKETGLFQGSVKAEVIGEEQGDRTPSGLWPSDHAGVWAALTIAPGFGHPN
jgi:endonuclease/exonuclease/phosphatase family metal-dependent hydrolase